MSDFDDILSANATYAAEHEPVPTGGRATRGLAVVTCMDTRIDPLRILGLRPGDAKILRNAGARVTDEVLRSLVLARHLLGVDRVAVVAHTQCRMAGGTEADVHAAVADVGGPDTRTLTFLTAPDQEAALREDVQRIRSSPYLPGLVTGGFLYDVATGRIQAVC